jgi:hypothetical protein
MLMDTTTMLLGRATPADRPGYHATGQWVPQHHGVTLLGRTVGTAASCSLRREVGFAGAASCSDRPPTPRNEQPAAPIDPHPLAMSSQLLLWEPDTHAKGSQLLQVAVSPPTREQPAAPIDPSPPRNEQPAAPIDPPPLAMSSQLLAKPSACAVGPRATATWRTAATRAHRNTSVSPEVASARRDTPPRGRLM